MLTINIEDNAIWDEENECFIPINAKTFTFEYSLLAISKWEEKWHVPYLQEGAERTIDQEYDFIRCMCNEEIDDLYLYVLATMYRNEFKAYMDDPHTATWFDNSQSNKKTNVNGSITTNETIYYMMFSAGIPKECENWHLQKLLTLIRVFGEKNAPPKKMSLKERYERQKMINEARKAKLGTKG